MTNSTHDTVRNFGMANLMIESALDNVENSHSVNLSRGIKDSDKDETYYPQFDEKIRKQASDMAAHYEIFYCLEQSIRTLIVQRLSEHGDDWWKTKIPQQVRVEAEKKHNDEIDKGITPRSYELIDYTSFGELSIIIVANWDETFNDMFKSKDAVRKVLAMLNTLRGPIAHCSMMDEHEVSRLHISLKDWFKLME